MTTDYCDELVCIGYATFYSNWTCNRYGDSGDKATEDSRDKAPFYRGWERDSPRDSEDEDGKADESAQMIDMTAYKYCNGPFRQFFRPIVEGIIKVETAKNGGNERVPDQRLRRLQHLFIDLINVLDDKRVWIEKESRKYCHRADCCPCEKCGWKETCPCSICVDRNIKE
ncbi:hypothetical protein V2W45_1454679 [Cenococcum geophilum]